MRSFYAKMASYTLIPSILLLSLMASTLAAQATKPSSRVSPQKYRSYDRQAVYIPLRDGVRLAADIFRPAQTGEVVTDPLPLIWTHDRYNRSSSQGNRTVDKMLNPTLRELVRRGYIVAAVDVRGGGASFGVYECPFSPTETQDASEVIDWFAEQSWCDGNIGMFGGSYLGATQYLAASTRNSHLKAIIPSVAPGDIYQFAWAGGIYRNDFLRNWSNLTTILDTQSSPIPVDADTDQSLLAKARKQHLKNRDTDEQFKILPYRDSVDENVQFQPYLEISPLQHLDKISGSNVAIFHLAGWFDCFTRDAWLLFKNYKGPQRIAMGPWFHQQRHEFDDMREHLRWYDHYLKGIDNGIDDEPPIHYYTFGAPEGERWRTANAWPLPEEERRTFFFSGGKEDHAGELTEAKPKKSNQLRYTVDYTTSSGTGNRWRNGYGGNIGYTDMAPNDEKGVTFTTAPLPADVEITGHPIAHLWISSTAKDGDFFVYLEEVEPNNRSQYVTEGCLRASHRAISTPPYDYLGLPYHRSFKEDVNELPGDPALLSIDLQPTSNIFDAKNRIRITITCADRNNTQTPELDPPPVITLYQGADLASAIELPFIPTSKN